MLFRSAHQIDAETFRPRVNDFLNPGNRQALQTKAPQPCRRFEERNSPDIFSSFCTSKNPT
jgi:hypothetical protein